LSDFGGMRPEQIAAEVLQIVRQVATELHPHLALPATLDLDSSLDQDFVFDSLGRVELLLRLEKEFEVALPESFIGRADTPRDLLRYVLERRGRDKLASSPELARINARIATSGELPELEDTLLGVLEWHHQRHPDDVHITLYDPDGEDQNISFRQLKEEALNIASGLQEMDLQPHEPVVLMLPTCEDYFYCFFGILYAGGVPCPVYPPVRASQIEEHLNRHTSIVSNAGASIMITPEEAIPFAGLLRHRVQSLRLLVTPDELKENSASPPLPKLRGADIAFLQYTSGSTGTPKGVVLTHQNLLSNVRAMGEAVQADSNDVFVSWLPLYHDMGLIGAWFGSLYHGAQLVIMSPLSFIARPRRWFEAIHRYRGTLSASPNFGYEHCIRLLSSESCQGLDLSSWRCAFNGAEAVNHQTLDSFCKSFADIGFSAEAMMPVYGLAENSVGLTFPPINRGYQLDHINRDRFMRSGYAEPTNEEGKAMMVVVSSGGVLPKHSLRVVDDNNRELADRYQGRIQFKGPSATSGYYRNPDKTASLFQGDWLETGDLGYVVEGQLYITGRQKDVIILAGRNFNPAELEEAVGEVEGIRKGRVVAFGSHRQSMGTERLIVVAETRVTDDNTLISLQAKINQISLELLGVSVDEVCLVGPNQILKTSSGKVRRSACKELYEQGNLTRRGAGIYKTNWLRIVLSSLKGLFWRFTQALIDNLYAGYCWLVFLLFAAVVIPVASFMTTKPIRWTVLSYGIRAISWLTLIPVRVEGVADLPDKDTPFVFVANHASYLDGYVLTGFLPRYVRYVVKSELNKNRVMAYLLGKLGVEFVERFDVEQGHADAARLANHAVGEGPLLFFPEGTFTRMPGLRSFHLGAFVAACKCSIPVVPIAIRGTRTILRAESWFPKRGNIIISFGKPILPTETSDTGEWQRAIDLRDRVRAEMLKLSGEIDLRSEEPLSKN